MLIANTEVQLYVYVIQALQETLMKNVLPSRKKLVVHQHVAKPPSVENIMEPLNVYVPVVLMETHTLVALTSMNAIQIMVVVKTLYA